MGEALSPEAFLFRPVIPSNEPSRMHEDFLCVIFGVGGRGVTEGRKMLGEKGGGQHEGDEREGVK